MTKVFFSGFVIIEEKVQLFDKSGLLKLSNYIYFCVSMIYLMLTNVYLQ